MGVLEKRMLNPEELKCPEDLITLETYMYNKEKQWVISFSYVKTLTSLEARGLGPSWFTSTDKLVLFFFGGHVGPLHKIHGYRNVSKCTLHHSGYICTTRGNNLKTSFSYMGQNVKKKYILSYLGGGGREAWGGLQLSDRAYLAIQLSSHPYLCTCQIRKQSDKK